MLVAVRKQTTFIINLKRSTLLTRGSATGRIPHLTQSGEAETGLTQLRQGLPGWRATGAGLYEPYFLGLQAEANACLGAVEQGLEIVANALDRVEETGEGWFEAELHRIMGELMLQLPKPDPIAAEAQFRHAAATARQQGAKLSPRVTSNSSGCGQSNSSTREAGQGTVSLSLFPGQELQRLL
ncbi:putative ATPase [Bradyrhizobium japonicum]